MLGSTKTTRQRRQRVYRVHLTWAAQRKHPHGQMRSVPRAPAATATRAPPRVASAPHASSAATASASASAGGSASGLVMPAARSIASTMETTCVVTAKLAGTFPVDHNAKLHPNDDGVSEELRSVRAERQEKLTLQPEASEASRRSFTEASNTDVLSRGEMLFYCYHPLWAK